jgi:hypothetical protein
MAITDPQPTLGKPLYDALIDSQETAGTDIGHVFAGLESMVCPSNKVDTHPFHSPISWTINMPNEEFASWGGDIGSAAAARAVDLTERKVSKPMSTYFAPGAEASPQDLQGDIDSYAIRKNLTGAACASAASTPIKRKSLSKPISDLLYEYYTRPSGSLAAERANKIPCFVESIGGTVVGTTITNRSAIRSGMSPKVLEFAEAFYAHLSPTAVLNPLAPTFLKITTREAIDEFLNFLESKL